MNTFGQKLMLLLWFILAKIRYSHYILCFYTLSVLQQKREAPLVITLVPTYHLHNLPLCLHLHWEIIIKSCNCPKYIYCWTNMNIYWSCETRLYSNFHLSFPHPTYDINRYLQRWGAMKHGPVIKHPQLRCVHSVEPGPPRRGAAANDPEVRLVRT